MTPQEESALSLTDKVINRKQQLFVRYVSAVLIDLTVLSLFNEFLPEYLYIASFSLALLTAIMLQFLLQLTLKFEHKFSEYFFGGKSGLKVNIMRGVSVWAIIFISKLVMLKAISIAFGSDVHFGGPVHGVVAFIIIITTMILVEQVFIRIHARLGN